MKNYRLWNGICNFLSQYVSISVLVIVSFLTFNCADPPCGSKCDDSNSGLTTNCIAIIYENSVAPDIKYLNRTGYAKNFKEDYISSVSAGNLTYYIKFVNNNKFSSYIQDRWIPASSVKNMGPFRFHFNHINRNKDIGLCAFKDAFNSTAFGNNKGNGIKLYAVFEKGPPRNPNSSDNSYFYIGWDGFNNLPMFMIVCYITYFIVSH